MRPYTAAIRIGNITRTIPLPRSGGDLSGVAKSIIDLMLTMYRDEELRAQGEQTVNRILGGSRDKPNV